MACPSCGVGVGICAEDTRLEQEVDHPTRLHLHRPCHTCQLSTSGNHQYPFLRNFFLGTFGLVLGSPRGWNTILEA